MTLRVSRRWDMGRCPSTSPEIRNDAPHFFMSSRALRIMRILQSTQGFMTLPKPWAGRSLRRRTNASPTSTASTSRPYTFSQWGINCGLPKKGVTKCRQRTTSPCSMIRRAARMLSSPPENRANACGVEVFIKLFYCAGYMNTSVCCVGTQGKRAWRRRLPDRTCPFLWGHRPMPRMRCGRTAGRIRVLSPPLDSGKAGFRDDL